MAWKIVANAFRKPRHVALHRRARGLAANHQTDIAILCLMHTLGRLRDRRKRVEPLLSQLRSGRRRASESRSVRR